MTEKKNSDIEYRQPPLVSVIILTMNRETMLEQCLRSVSDQAFPDFEVIVVDNASDGGTGAMVKSRFPEVRYHRLDSNRGVAGGRNYGVQVASGELCVFIDDDAVFANDCALERVVAYFYSDDRLGCVAFRIVDPRDGSEEYKGIPRLDKKSMQKDYECGYFCGAGFACRRSMFIERGMFWEPLFFIGEELDFSYRLLNAGHTLVHSYGIPVVHYETPQARVKGSWVYHGVRSRCWMAVRNLPWPNVVSHVLLWWGYFFVSAVGNGHFRSFARGVRDALAGLPEALRTRSCITRRTICRLKELSGRVYY